MSIRAKCSNCGKVVKGGDDWTGRFATCPGCGSPIAFPEADPFDGLEEFASLHEAGKRLEPPPLPPPLPITEAQRFSKEVATTSNKYLYRMVQIPPTIVVAKAKGDEAAEYLEGIVNRHAEHGWEFYRIDQIGVQVAPGCMGILMGMRNEIHHFYVITFRRPRA